MLLTSPAFFLSTLATNTQAILNSLLSPNSPSLSHISEPLCTPLLLSRMPLHVPSLAGGKVTPPSQNSHVLIPEQAMLHSMEKKLRIFWHRIKLNILIWRDYPGLSGDAKCNPKCPLMREAEGDLTYTEERAMWMWRQRLEWHDQGMPAIPRSWKRQGRDILKTARGNTTLTSWGLVVLISDFALHNLENSLQNSL